MSKIVPYTRIELGNGMEVFTYETKSEIIESQLFVKAGEINSRYKNGLAHFCEHCLIAGGSNKYSPEEIVDFMQSLKGKRNAGTDPRYIMFMNSFLPRSEEELRQYFTLLSEISLNPAFRNDDVEQAKGRFIQEIKMNQAMPEEVINNEIYKALFSGNFLEATGFGGDPNYVRALTRDDLIGYHKKWFYPNNARMIVATDTTRMVQEMIADAFGEYEGGDFELPKDSRCNRLDTNKWVAIQNGDIRTHIGIGFVGPTRNDNDFQAFEIANIILGGDERSMLFNRISEEGGYTYAIDSQIWNLYDNGAVVISTEVEPECKDEVIQKVLEICNGLPNSIEEKEVSIIKDLAEYSLKKSLESSGSVVGVIRSELESGMTTDEYYDKLSKVTTNEVREAAEKYLGAGCVIVTDTI
jgi:predicted Zn-dependent peptidase